MAETVPLTKGYSTIVDDVSVMGGFRWKALLVSGKVYAARNNRGKNELLHRTIVQAPAGLEVDHINGDSLDNRRSNLRLATRQQNAWNMRAVRPGTSRFRGVHWSSKDRRWVAQIAPGPGSKQYLGNFEDEVEAAVAYDRAALAIRGEFAVLNFPVVKKGPNYVPVDFSGLLP